MIANEVNKLECENRHLKAALAELNQKMEQNSVVRPKTCQYCRHYIQHYIRDRSGMYAKEYVPIYDGHCVRGVPIRKGGKKRPVPDDSCPYFEIGTNEIRR